MTQPRETNTTPSQTGRNLVGELLERHYSVAAGELVIGEIPISQIAREFGTPLFVYDQSVLQRKWELLRGCLPQRFDIYFSVKANPNQAILKYFVERGCGLEIASSGELIQAIEADCPPTSILFAGPGKSDEELTLAISHGIGEIHLESLSEAKRLAAIAHGLHKRIRVALRINPSEGIAGGGMRMGAKPAPFGIDEDQLEPVLDWLHAESALELTGIHMYVGTQILDAQVLLTQYQAAIKIAQRVANRSGRPLLTIDLGGGLGIPYFAHEAWLDLDELRLGLVPLLEELQRHAELHDARLIVEPGRFLVAEAGIYVARVVDVKTSRGKKFIIADGGMHHHLAASGNLGQTIKRNFPVAVLNKLDAAPSESADIVGPLCTPLDVLARNLSVPDVEIGDLIGVFQSGAYARSASPLGFLSRRSPAEVMVAGNQAKLIRRGGSDEDYLLDQSNLQVGP